MSIAWSSFTPWSALLGGIIIGLASTALVLTTTRVAGISGIVAGALHPDEPGERGSRVAFVLGLVLAPALFALFYALPHATIAASPIEIVIAGLLVGLGTRYGAGCTSGHGVCGLSRLSPRSLAATGLFMFAGFVTVFVLRHVALGAIR